MAIASLVTIGLTLWLLPGSAWSPFSTPFPAARLVVMTLGGALVATAAEALSPAGTDNLSVPLLTGLALFLLAG